MALKSNTNCVWSTRKQCKHEESWILDEWKENQETEFQRFPPDLQVSVATILIYLASPVVYCDKQSN